MKIIIDINNKKINNIKAELLNEEQVNIIINNKVDNYIEKKLNNIQNETNEFLNKIIAYSNKTLSGDRLIVRQHENELGNFAANACKNITNADISIVNGGDIRTSLLAGPITYKDILAIFPFQNNIHVYEVTGNIIKEMLEHSVEFVPASFGGFLSISSNIQFIYNLSLPAKNRIKEIYINNELLDLEKKYSISMSSFIAAGGDDYTMLTNLKKLGEFDTIENIIIKYINEYGIQEKDYKLGRIITE